MLFIVFMSIGGAGGLSFGKVSVRETANLLFFFFNLGTTPSIKSCSLEISDQGSFKNNLKKMEMSTIKIISASGH